MNLESRIINVQSWWIASELLRRNPGLGVIETHPGGGQSDCLSIFRCRSHASALAHLNREGSIHVGDDELPRITWAEDRGAHDRHHCIKLIESRAGLGTGGKTARTTAAVLVARMAYHLLLTNINARSTWDIRNVRLDTSGYGNGEGDVVGFPSAKVAIAERRPDDPWGDSRYRFWHVLKDGERVVVLDNDGLVHLRDRDPLDMMSRFEKSDRSLAAVGAWLHDILDGG